ncbi:Ca2+-binding EF-hand superfamily protein [Rhizobium sp. SG_E_25_P2]|jgi:Ca2+-binding EF-hand superfamily protein|uniref:EF-hand domain-containing protein n=1 Tax=Rhizobium sp. SG_E_25_P2 TaxID=2879942 RepID=UPI002476FB67|nr:EF-hand domain-containing protein [Rhizobium sp. SG_E_25_P2]MDH6265921.1 Ca2+-binding EF-hand superfamily protein [Rhizobium sp. SG_E_25_P2]
MSKTIAVLAVLFAAGLITGPVAAQAQEVFAKVDVNGDGGLDLTEFTGFIDAAAEAGKPNAKKIQANQFYAKAFARIDKNKDGLVTKNEIAAMR